MGSLSRRGKILLVCKIDGTTSKILKWRDDERDLLRSVQIFGPFCALDLNSSLQSRIHVEAKSINKFSENRNFTFTVIRNC
jgi:hypothetical protein